MSQRNFERMIALAEQVFDIKNDPSQIDVNEEVIKLLQEIHPATVSEVNDGEGPIAWVIVIPTTQKLMMDFIDNKLSEKQLLEFTLQEKTFDSIYLCSALVLEEYRRKGIVKNKAIESIEEIMKQHDIGNIFVWSFTKEGDQCAEAIASKLSLKLSRKI
ncbi:MAG: hypothetical protein HYZ42_11910 [Bacteroidetes bacterium]|nr:hypothetical protein [Bacteroidota bacterium]